jgi:hypothetical protein
MWMERKKNEVRGIEKGIERGREGGIEKNERMKE